MSICIQQLHQELVEKHSLSVPRWGCVDFVPPGIEILAIEVIIPEEQRLWIDTTEVGHLN